MSQKDPQSDPKDAAETAAKDYQNKPLWNGLISRGMAKDFSWKKAAGEYLEIIK